MEMEQRNGGKKIPRDIGAIRREEESEVLYTPDSPRRAVGGKAGRGLVRPNTIAQVLK